MLVRWTMEESPPAPMLTFSGPPLSPTKMFATAIALLVTLTSCQAYPDYFTFGATNENQDTYGPADWDKVECKNVDTCVRFPVDDVVAFAQ
jgi:hypothetical protein